MSNSRLASRTRLLAVLMLLAMVLASVTLGVNAQGLRDVNNPTQGVQAQPGEPQKIVRTDNAKPGIYHIDYLNDYYKLDPSKYPIDGSTGFWTWSTLNPADGRYDWTPPANPPSGWLGKLDTWIKDRVDRSTTPTGVGIMISTYDGTTATDILSTPNWVIKLNDAVIPATTQSGVDHYIDYYHRTSKKHLNGEFDNALPASWVVSNSAAITYDTNPPTDGHVSATPTLPDRPASGPAVRLGGLDNLNATLAKDSQDTLDIPAMPPSLNGKQNVYVQVRVHIDTATADPNDHLYMELWDKSGNKLGGAQQDISLANYSGSGATYWQEYRFDVTSFATEKGVRAAFRVVTDGATPTTFWIDNVQLRVRHLIPKYCCDPSEGAYKKFIAALGQRYKASPLGDPKYDLQFVAMGTGTYGESQPTQDVNDWEYKSTFDHVIKTTPDKGMDTTGEWQAWVNEMTLAYAQAFASGDGTGPARHLLLQYAPSFISGEERGYTTDYAAGLGVGISHNRLTPEFTSVYRNDKSGFYDPIRLYWNSVPVAVEAYATDLGCSPVMSYWAVMGGVEKHVDFIRTDPDLLRDKNGNVTGHDPILDWAGNYLGKTIQNTPKVWTVMREHRNPSVLTCSSSYYVDTGTASSYPQYGNYNFWLYQVEPNGPDGKSLGGKTVAETNDKGADSRYANVPGTGNPAPQAGLGNCPDKAYSNIYIGNPPSCNNKPYNPDLPPLVGQSAASLYDPTTWTGAGKEAWVVRRTDQATNNPYMLFRIDDGYMKAEGTQVYKAAITVKYFDIGTDKFSIKYDSSSNEKVAGTVTKTNTKQLKSVTFTVSDAKFANRLLGSTDFFLDSRDPATGANDGNEWVHMVEVEKLGADNDTPTPSPTPTQTLTPSPTATATPTTGAVEGKTFNDLNKNNKLDAGEPTVAGAQIALFDFETDQQKYAAMSGADGLYRIADVVPGQYVLREIVAPPGYTKSSYSIILSVTANNTNNVGTNFGHTAENTATPTATASPTPSTTPSAPAEKKVFLPLLLK